MLVYYKKQLKKGTNIQYKSSENIWLKVSKWFICHNKDFYIAGVCNSLRNSRYTKGNLFNFLDILRYQLSKFSSSVIIFIGGNFNSSIGNQPDFINEIERALNCLSWEYELDTIRSVRNNEHISANECDQQSVDLSITTMNEGFKRQHTGRPLRSFYIRCVSRLQHSWPCLGIWNSLSRS